MKDFAQPDGNNLGGVLTFNFIPVDDVSSFPNLVNNKIVSPITLKTGAMWFKGYSTLEKTKFQEPDDDTPAGTIFKKAFTGFYPKDTEEINILFNQMRNRKFIVDYTDMNHVRKIIGTISEGLKFSSTLNTGEKVADLAGHSFKFYGDGTAKAFIYDI